MRSWLSGRGADGIYIQHVHDILYCQLILQQHSKPAEVFLAHILEEQPIKNYNNPGGDTGINEGRKKRFQYVSQVVKILHSHIKCQMKERWEFRMTQYQAKYQCIYLAFFFFFCVREGADQLHFLLMRTSVLLELNSSQF